MGNCLPANYSKNGKALPIETTFKPPAPIPIWPPGEGFGTGTIDLGGGLHVIQISSFQKIWTAHDGGPDNTGATFFEPANVPQDYSILGSYAQPNNTPLFGRVLAAKDAGTGSGSPVKKPVDYTLVWSSESLKIKQDGVVYIWLPTPPDGYKAVGHVITNSPNKPPLNKIRCVRSDFTDESEVDTSIWGQGGEADGLRIFSIRPKNRGIETMGLSVGSFSAQIGGKNMTPLACLKNKNATSSCMPNLRQVEAIFEAYAPYIYFHPDEKYLPSSVNWYFSNGALLYKKGEESNPVPVEPPAGSNLPQGGSNDDAYWLDLPKDDRAKDLVKKGDLESSEVYLHVKPAQGATCTDIATWIFHPFNGPGRAKIEFITVSLGRIGEHVGDWEHVTLRISNFNGELQRVFFSQHSGGTWVNASELEYHNGGDGGSNRVVAYSSLNGHAMYAKPGLVLQGSGTIGIRNDTAKSDAVLDAGKSFSIVGAEYLSAAEPPWVNYFRKWGPKISYDIAVEIKKVERLLPGKLKAAFQKVVEGLPDEVFGEEGPTGPKAKGNWSGDEI